MGQHLGPLTSARSKVGLNFSAPAHFNLCLPGSFVGIQSWTLQQEAQAWTKAPTSATHAFPVALVYHILL